MTMLVTENAPTDTSIRILASDGTSYTTLALLEAAGKQPWPALDPGMNLGKLSVRSLAAGGVTNGSGFNYIINQTKPSAISSMKFVSGGGQERQSGSTKAFGNDLLMVWQLWFAMSVATDILEACFEY